ncbi:MAG: hypothetical protein QNJ84_11885 [Alphaproteobacteria bacterium]|nr:hypothetical protein [Alphaproteobacteria bacterium]
MPEGAKLFILKDTVASGERVGKGSIVEVGEDDARMLLNMGRARRATKEDIAAAKKAAAKKSPAKKPGKDDGQKDGSEGADSEGGSGDADPNSSGAATETPPQDG